MIKIAVLGPEYSYSHLVGLRLFPKENLILCNKIEEVFRAVAEQKAEKGVIPVENMLQGSVRESIICFLKYKVKINESCAYPIRHCLAGKNQHYDRIVSHPQALAQCSVFLSGKNVAEASSTSKAMETAAQDQAFAAIGSIEAAGYYGLQVLQKNIEDNHDNVTRFLVISLEETRPAENTNLTSSLLLTPKEDRPGLLFLLLAPFAAQNINLVKIESLPSGRKMGEYIFYIEIDGNVAEERVKNALEFLQNSVEVYSLGSYQMKELK